MSPASILIVDDTTANLRLLAELLTRAGYRVRSAINGTLALSGAIAQPPDLILLDIMMPDLSGYEVCQHLKNNQRTRDVPVIFLSALEDAADKVKAFEVGGADYIGKPFQKAEILARVENQLAMRRLQEQLSEQNEQLQAEVRERAAAQQQLHQFSASLKQLHRLDTTPYPSLAARYADYLQTGCQLFGLELAWLSRVQGDHWSLEASDNLPPQLPAERLLAAMDASSTLAHLSTTAEHNSHQATAKLPWPLGAHLGTPLWVSGQLYGALGFAALAPREQPFSDQECELVELMAESLGKFLATHQEELKRQRAEEETRLLLRITQAIAAAPDFEAALAVALTQVSEASGWSYAEAWLPDSTGQVLVCAPIWYGSDRQALASFRALSVRSHRQRQEGLAGRVWATARPEFINDLSRLVPGDSVRQPAMQQAGLGAELGVPIVAPAPEGSQTQPTVLAVVIFFRRADDSFASPESQQRSVDLAVAIAAQLGTVLQHKQIEVEQSAILLAMTDLVLVRDRQGRCLKILPTRTTSLTRSPEEIVGYTLHDIMPQPLADRLLAAVQAALDEQATQNVEYYVKRGERTLWLAASISPLDRERAILVARDISERKQREDALQLIAQGTAEVSGNEFFQSCAHALAQALGVRYVLIGRFLPDKDAPPEALALWDDHRLQAEHAYRLTGALGAGLLAGEEQVWLREAQAQFPEDAGLAALGVESYWGLPLRDSQQAVIGYIVLMDVEPMERNRQTDLILEIFAARAGGELERKLAAEALQASEERNQAILRAIPDLMFRVRADGIYLGYVKTHEFADLLPPGYDPVGQHLRKFLPPMIALRHLKHLKQALATGAPQVYEQEVTAQNRTQYEEVRVVVSGPDEALFIVRNVSDRKRAELALRVAQQKSESLLLNILPRPIAERLKQQPGSIAEQFDEATILFADIVGFTPLAAQMTPIEVVNLLNQIFSEFDRLADRFQLEKIKTIGDAYMVVGGVPTAQVDHAIAVAEMALEMQAAITRTRTERLRELRGDRPLQMRIGIHTGSVVAGVIGAKKFIYDLWGDAVNIASRMESQGEAGRIQITAATHEQLGDRFQCEQRGTITVRGRGEIATYWLLGRQVEPLNRDRSLVMDS